MRRSSAVVTSAAWFVVTGGVGAILVPWWLTGWRLQHPLPYWSVAEAVGILLIVAGLILAVHVFVQFVRAGGTPMPGAMTRRLVVTGFNRHVRNPIYLAAMTIFVGQTLLFTQLSMLFYTIAVWVGAAAFVRWYEEPALAARSGQATTPTIARCPPGVPDYGPGPPTIRTPATP